MLGPPLPVRPLHARMARWRGPLPIRIHGSPPPRANGAPAPYTPDTYPRFAPYTRGWLAGGVHSPYVSTVRPLHARMARAPATGFITSHGSPPTRADGSRNRGMASPGVAF